MKIFSSSLFDVRRSKFAGLFVAASLVLVGASSIPAEAHQDPALCNASGLQQFPSIAPLGSVHAGDVITYSVTYVNSDPDGAGPIAPCNITGANATIDLPGAAPIINVLTNATLNVGDSVSCPGGAGCAAGPYTYVVNPADEASSSVTAAFDIAGVLHQDANEEAASDHDTLSKTVIHPSTITSITSSASQVVSGGTVNLTVKEKNDGDVPLTGASTTVDHGVGALTPASPGFSGDDADGILEPGETWQWVVTSVVVNASTTFTAIGHGIDPLGKDITYPFDPEERDSVSVSVANPSTIVDIASSASLVNVGGTVNLTIKEKNDGDVPLKFASTTVDNGVGTLTAASPNFSGDDGDGVLEPGETWQWIVNNVVVNASTTFTVIGHGTDPLGNDVTYPADQQEKDSVSVEVIKLTTQGCSPGYWKQKQHFDSYVTYSPTDKFDTVFGETVFPGKTLVQVLSQGGGGINALGRIITGALLNSSSISGYPYTSAQVIADFKAVHPGTKDAYNTLKDKYEALQDPCPLN
jgi:hypothetical protein